MALDESDITHLMHHRDSVVRDAIEDCAKRHRDHAEREARARTEALLHRISDEMTERARMERAKHG